MYPWLAKLLCEDDVRVYFYIETATVQDGRKAIGNGMTSLKRNGNLLRFQRGTSEPADSQNSTAYALSAVGDSLRFVFQVDHQDLMKKVRDLGLES
jgi:hypothetical protein